MGREGGGGGEGSLRGSQVRKGRGEEEEGRWLSENVRVKERRK